MSACRTCHQRIVWARTAAGKAIPLDPDPVPGGNVVLVAGVATVLGPIAGAYSLDPPRHQSHFATCPQADSHRRSR